MRVILLFTVFIASLGGTPIAFFHGMGDQCSNPGFTRIVSYVGEMTGSYSKCIEVGNGAMSSLFMSFMKQAEEACINLLNDSVFNSSASINVVGLSQGSLIARYIAQKCKPIKVKTWISIGGPNQGVSKIPHCSNGIFCNAFNWFAGKMVYTGLVQQHFGPAGYYRSLKSYQKYLNNSVFLPYLNNEKPNLRDPEAKERFSSIERAVLWKFTKDTMIIPRESQWFGYYKDETYDEVILFNQTQLYREDWIGFQSLHQAGKVEFISVKGNHLQFGYEDIDSYLIPYVQD